MKTSIDRPSRNAHETFIAALPSSGSRRPLHAETFSADVWADNWFEMRINGEQVAEDSVPITTERSFNAESFEFEAERPFVIGLVAKDFKENDTGLEYIGTGRQQMGDGGVILQIKDAAGETVAVSNADWQCLVIHTAPLDKSCEGEANPVAGEGACALRGDGRARRLGPGGLRRLGLAAGKRVTPSARSAPRTATTGSTGSRTPA